MSLWNEVLADERVRKAYDAEVRAEDLMAELSALLQQRGITQRALAERLGVSPSAVSQALSCANPGLPKILRMADAAGFDMEITFRDRTARLPRKWRGGPSVIEWEPYSPVALGEGREAS